MLGGNEEAEPKGSDFAGLLADLLEGARRLNLSANSVAAYERTWTKFLAGRAAASFDPRAFSFSYRLGGLSVLRGGQEKATSTLARVMIGSDGWSCKGI